MRISDRKLPFIDPAKVWISPLSDAQYQFWPPVRRGRGRSTGADDGGDDGDHAIEDDEVHDDSQDEDEGGVQEVEMHRDVINLLDEGLLAMRATASSGSKKEGAGDDEDNDFRPPDSDDDSSSDSSTSSTTSDAAMPAAASGDADEVDAVLRGSADVAFSLPDGSGIIRYYSSKQAFTAECSCHAKCVKTRQSTPGAALATVKKPGPSLLAKGRPLGLLAAWLQDGSNHENKGAHWQQENELVATTLEKRKAARAMIAASETGLRLLAFERAPRAHEADEPEGLA